MLTEGHRSSQHQSKDSSRYSSGAAQASLDEDDDDPSRPLLKAPLKFIVTTPGGVIVRDGPSVQAPRTNTVLHCGDLFEVDDIVSSGQHWENRPVDDCCFLHLKNGDGWVLDKNIVTEEDLVEGHNPDMSGRERLFWNIRKFFRNKSYEYLITAIIVINAILIGIEIDNPGIMAYHHWLIINTVFAIIYLVEMLSKVIAFPWSEFVRSSWNIFDVVITVITLAGDVYMMYMYFATHGHGEHGAFMILIPVLRLLRLFRVAKLFHELRLLVQSFAGSLVALAWIAAFSLMWFYLCGCVCTVFLGRKDMLADGDVENAGALREKFASIPLSMFTLFEVMTLEAFTDVVSPLVKHRPFLLLFFLVFVFVTAFFLLNLVTAVVVKKTMQTQKDAEKAKDNVQEDWREAQITAMYAAFLEQNDGNNMIKVQNFRRFQEDQKVQQVMTQLDWDTNFLNSMIVMVDHNKAEDEVSLKEMKDLWDTYEQPLDTKTVLYYQMQTARRLEMQEKLCMELLEKEKLCIRLLEKLERGDLKAAS